MGMNGLMRAVSIGIYITVCMEISSPSQAVLLYNIELFFDGIGALVAPYLGG